MLRDPRSMNVIAALGICASLALLGWEISTRGETGYYIALGPQLPSAGDDEDDFPPTLEPHGHDGPDIFPEGPDLSDRPNGIHRPNGPVEPSDSNSATPI